MSSLLKVSIMIWVLSGAIWLASDSVLAVVDPRDAPNNRFGIHITDKHDLEAAARLVNSNGGDWGYVKFVIREDQMDIARWQAMFDRMRELRLIPIVRIATRVEGSSWIKPLENKAKDWANFLNSLNWITRNRYVVLFNEPNHAKEWGGELKPDEYARMLRVYTEALRERSDDFFILPGAIDAAAADTRITMRMDRYLVEMYQEDSEVFTLFDGWNSHSYPNPGFRGSPYDRGRQSIRGWEWEVDFLRRYGLPDDIPVFITETGWKHNNEAVRSPYPAPSRIAEYFRIAFQDIWTDERIVAVTPFILDYPDKLFANFSWRAIDGREWHEHYEIVRELPKSAGRPVVRHESQHISRYIPSGLLTESEYMVAIRLKNTGQSIWDPREMRIETGSSFSADDVWTSMIPSLKPFEEGVVWLRLMTPDVPGEHWVTLDMATDEGSFGEAILLRFEVISYQNPVARFRLWIERMLHPQELMVRLRG